MSSRTPVNGVGYDHSLLADAPQITKADKQEGYNPDLLEAQPNSRATPVLLGGATTPSKPKYAGASDDGHLRNAAAVQPLPPTKTRPRKVIFIIVGVVLLVVVAVAVGVGVGVSKSHGGGDGGASTQGAQSDPGAVTTSKSITPVSPTKNTTSSPSTTQDGVAPGSAVTGTDSAIGAPGNAPTTKT